MRFITSDAGRAEVSRTSGGGPKLLQAWLPPPHPIFKLLTEDETGSWRDPT